MSILLSHIVRYPIKSLGPDFMNEADLSPQGCLPFDRHWALAYKSGQAQEGQSGWRAKKNFLNLTHIGEIAKFTTQFDENNERLVISRKGKILAQGRLNEAHGRIVIENFINSFLKSTQSQQRGDIRITRINEENTGFQDGENQRLSLINMASLRDLEDRVLKAKIHPLRFRGNLYFDGDLPAWGEHQNQDALLVAKEGGAILRIGAPLERCKAVNVNPDTGEEDMNIPQALRRGYNHIDFGSDVIVVKQGHIKTGQEFELIKAEEADNELLNLN